MSHGKLGKMPDPHICPVGVLSFNKLTVIYNKVGDPHPRLLGGAQVILTPELQAAIDADKQHRQEQHKT